MNIRHLQRYEIDNQRWDRCIKKAINGSIYGYAWFLDTVAEGWEALVDENYDIVMPLPNRSIMGVCVLFQPYYATNLGVYSTKILDTDTVNEFVKAIPVKYQFVQVNLNKYNKLTIEGLRIKKDIHFELDLIESYAKIRSRYSQDVKLGLSVAAEQKISVIQGLNSNDLISLYKKSKGPVRNLIFRKRYRKLQTLVSTSVRYRVGQVYGAYDGNNRLCAAGFFVWSHQRVTLLRLSVTKSGIEKHAIEAIIDHFIQHQSEHSLTLRFEYATRNKYGSTYSGFGAKQFNFMNIKMNRLPWPLNWAF